MTPALQHFLSLSPEGQFRAFARWIGKQRPTTKFRYMDNHNCAKARFGKSLVRGSSLEDQVHCGHLLSFTNNYDISVPIIPATFEEDFADCETMGQVKSLCNKIKRKKNVVYV